jgi:hypothetical protein
LKGRSNYITVISKFKDGRLVAPAFPQYLWGIEAERAQQQCFMVGESGKALKIQLSTESSKN